MRILVTGGAGFIGSHTVDALLEKGHQVRILDSLERPVHQKGWPSYVPREAELIHGQVTDRETLLRALQGMQAVVHLAAYQDYLPDFSKFFHVNPEATALLYELVVNERLPVEKVVVASSQAVYGEGKYYCDHDGVQYPGPRSLEQLYSRQWELTCPSCHRRLQLLPTDEATVNPHNSYAISKYAQELTALRLGRRYSVPTVALRYSIVQGPRQSFYNAYSGALRSFAVQVLNGRPPVLYEDGYQLRDYVSIWDVVQANLLALEDPRADYRVFNVGGARQVTVRELAAMVLEEAVVDVEPESPGLFRVGDTRHIISDVSQLQELGWTPKVSQRDMVRKYLAWASQEPHLPDSFTAAEAQMKALGVLRSSRNTGS